MKKINEETISIIEEKVGYVFINKGLLSQAFTRESYATEQRVIGNEIYGNEQLEFYGDSVLNFILVSNAQENFSSLSNDQLIPFENEGMLTSYISHYTQKSMLSSRIEALDLNKYLIVNQGDINNNIQNSISVKEDLFEAIIGAIWIDSNKDLKQVEKSIFRMLDFKNNAMQDYTNPINKLERLATEVDVKITYETINLGEEVVVTCRLFEKEYSTDQTIASAKVEKEAMKLAAKEMIEIIKKEFNVDNYIIYNSDFTIDNAVNKLQELSQKKKIGHVLYSNEFNYDTSMWTTTCSISNFNNEFIGINKIKTTSKKEAAFNTLNYLASSTNKDIFNPYEKEVIYLVYENNNEVTINIGIIDSKQNDYITAITYPDNKKISFSSKNININTGFKYQCNAFYEYVKLSKGLSNTKDIDDYVFKHRFEYFFDDKVNDVFLENGPIDDYELVVEMKKVLDEMTIEQIMLKLSNK